MLPTAFSVGPKRVGPNHPALIVAEIGINHNGSLDLARQMIDAAADAGADSVKFQNYRTEDFIRDRTLVYRYESAGQVVEESQYAMFKRCEIDDSFLAAVSAQCQSRGLVFHSTPTSSEGVDQLVRLNAPLLKNGSDYLTNLDLIDYMAGTGLPLVLSTGMATEEEIEDAVQIVRGCGNDKLILLHCTSTYPTPMVEANLRRIPELATRFGCLAGFSDHTEGTTAAAAAVALGAVWIEKHFTIDRSLPGPDQRFSSDPAEFRALVQAVRATETALGSARIAPTETEEASRRDFRLSCVAAHDIEPGAILSSDDLVFARPGNGLAPKMKPAIVGRRLTRPVAAGSPFALEDFE